MTDQRLILLNESDNVFVCCQKVAALESIDLEHSQLTLTGKIEIGHKIARHDINKGQSIIKYGVSIGSARKVIHRGDHVHLHNLKSDYIASHTRTSVTDIADTLLHTE